MDVEQKENTLWKKVQRTEGLLAIFLIKTLDGSAFRTAAVNKKELFFKARNTPHATLVGMYDLRAKPEWVLEDMEYTLEEMK